MEPTELPSQHLLQHKQVLSHHEQQWPPTADTIIVYDANYNELDRIYNSQNYKFTGLNPGTVIVEIYEDDVMVADDQDTVTAGSTQTVNLYANAKVGSKSEVFRWFRFPWCNGETKCA